MINIIRKKIRSKENNGKDTKLIHKLKTEHKKLLKLFEEAEEKFKLFKKYKKDKYKKKFFKALDKFLEELKLHLILENSRLYTYIEIKYKLCDLDKMQQIKNEIENNFYIFIRIKLYCNLGYIRKSEKLLQKLKNFLIKRIVFEEEKLYNLYQNVYKCEEIKKILSY